MSFPIKLSKESPRLELRVARGGSCWGVVAWVGFLFWRVKEGDGERGERGEEGERGDCWCSAVVREGFLYSGVLGSDFVCFGFVGLALPVGCLGDSPLLEMLRSSSPN